jgi:hypothetical protein
MQHGFLQKKTKRPKQRKREDPDTSKGEVVEVTRV